MLHALRNTVSHGAESPEARRSAGKPEALSVTLSVASKGSQLVVTIRDDGRGPDLARILETGRRQGLVAPGPEPGPDDILDLVFAPGFSTATAIDRIAGRGMACRWWRRPRGPCAAGPLYGPRSPPARR